MDTLREKSAPEAYAQFLFFVQNFSQAERSATSRRLFSVFLWCFLIPLIVSGVLLVLVNYHVLPRSYRSLVDGILLLFPVIYSVYYLSTSLFPGLRSAMRHGGLAANLQQAKTDQLWRAQATRAMRDELKFSPNDWRWIVANFETDLDRMQARTKHMTALAGAVFFMIMQGIDLITTETMPVATFLETVNPMASEWVGLALFLLLLYLSGQQSHQHLARYLPCARWVRDELL